MGFGVFRVIDRMAWMIGRDCYVYSVFGFQCLYQIMNAILLHPLLDIYISMS